MTSEERLNDPCECGHALGAHTALRNCSLCACKRFSPPRDRSAATTKLDLEGLRYHAYSSGTSTPLMVREQILAACEEIDQLRADVDKLRAENEGIVALTLQRDNLHTELDRLRCACAPPDAKHALSWLAKIEALKPGDACEFHYPARSEWLPGTVVKNGGSGYWSVRDDSDREGQRGQVSDCLYIWQIRLPGQTEAWT